MKENLAMRKLPCKRKSSDEATDSPAKRQRVGPSLDSEASEVLSAVTPDSTTSSKPVEVTEERCRLFMQLLHKCCAEKNQAQSLNTSVVRTFFSKTEKKSPFANVSFLILFFILSFLYFQDEFDACIDKMSDEKKGMLSGHSFNI